MDPLTIGAVVVGAFMLSKKQSGSVSTSQLQSLVRQNAVAASVPESWADSQALVELVKHESANNPAAKNPSSTAFGLFQFLKSTWAQYLPEVPYGSTDANAQVLGGLRYIKDAYGSPERAWDFWQATVNKDASVAPADLQYKASNWISKNWAGY